MILIGITGAIGHGKSRMADAFLKLGDNAIHDESSKLISEFANKAKSAIPSTVDNVEINLWLKSIVLLIEEELHTKVDLSRFLVKEDDDLSSTDLIKLVEYIELLQKQQQLRGEMINESTKPRHRAILQWFGGYFVNNISRTIWYDEIIRRSKAAEQQGCELYIVGGLRFPEDAEVIRQAKGKVIEVVRPDFRQTDLTDPTERERADITYDIRILNNGTLEELEVLAQGILQDIKNNTFQTEYSSHS